MPAAPAPSAAPSGAIVAGQTTTTRITPSAPSKPSGDDRPAQSAKDELYAMLDEPTPPPKTDKAPEERQETPPEAELDPTPTDQHPAADKTPTEPKPGSKPEGKVAPLRQAYEKSKARIKELETEVQTLRTSRNGDDPAKLSEAVTAANKRAEALEQELRYVRYEKSEEFRDKFVKPKEVAFQKAYGDVTQMEITDAEGNTRLATVDDFNALLRLPLAEAHKASKAFGDFAQEVMAHRRKILDLADEQRRAVEDYRTKGEEHEKQTSAQRHAAAVKEAQTFRQLNTKAMETYKDWFAPVDGDEIGNKLLQFGEGLAEKVFGDNSSIPPEERVKIFSAAYNKIRGFDRLAHRIKEANKRIKELEKAVKDFEDSGPTGGFRRTPAGANGAKREETYQEELDRIDREGKR